MTELKLPDHIIKKSETWYFNAKTQKWLHRDRIEGFLKTYWANKTTSKKPKVSYKTNLKAAKRRWDNE